MVDENSSADGGARPRLVVVGSSAGGIEALSVLVSTLPEDFPAPVVIAQHLSPSRESHLEEILSRRCALPVRTVTGHEPLQGGVVYVVPADRHVNISDSEIEVSAQGGKQPRPSVDLLLSSAAKSVGEGLIAIVLTGTGTDGAAGAAAVKKAGGTVIIQNPATAEYPAMPLSLAPSSVDIVAELERMGAILGDLLAGIAAPAEAQQKRALQSLLEEVRERNGIDFSDYKMPTIMRRLQRRILATENSDVEGYSRYVAAHPEEYQQLVNSFLVKVTEFFRDSELFDYLREEVMPRLVEEARERNNEIRLWSAGCATGEEAYSLAIVLAEELTDEIGQFDIRIFATDVDDGAVSFARNGVYSGQALEGVSESLLERYFESVDGADREGKLIRGMLVFGRHDLGQRAPFPRIDMVLSRNVLIYFTPELQRRALDLFAHSLRDGGRLVLGKAESVSQREGYFESGNREQKVFIRRGGRFTMPASLIESPPPSPGQRTRYSLTASSETSEAGTSLGADAHGSSFSEESLLRELPVGVVVVDSRYDILLINSAAQSLLSIYSPAVGEDLLHLLQADAYTKLRPAIDAALRDQVSVEVEEFTLQEPESDKPRYLKMVVYPRTGQPRSGQLREGETSTVEASSETEAASEASASQQSASADSVMIAVSDVSSLGRERDELRERNERDSSELERKSSQGERLTENNRRLQKANQELTKKNEELQANNEELSLSAEEAQAATEEVETLNEELQATNEELETLNEELQATIEELNTTTDDQRARSRQLQQTVRDGETRQDRLEAALQSLDLALIVVGSDGGAVLSNAAYEEIFGEADLEQIQLLDADGGPLSGDASPALRAARGESFAIEFIVASEGGERRRYEAIGRPLRMEGFAVPGGLVMIRESSPER